MDCPHCGAQVEDASRFCPRCRKRVVAPSAGFGDAPSSSLRATPETVTPPPAHEIPAPQRVQPPAVWPPPGSILVPLNAAAMQRPGIVTFLAVLDLLGGALLLLLVAASVVAAIEAKTTADQVVVAVLGSFYAVLGLLNIAAGIGLLQMKNWGRILQIGIACVGLLAIGCGTVISALVLVYMFKPGVRVLFSGKTFEELMPNEAADVAMVRGGSTATTVLVAIAVVFVGVAMVGIIAAIAIPSLLRARISANEAGAIAHLRTIGSAQANYASLNGGFPDTPGCLRRPADCIPGYVAAGALLNESVLFDAPVSGYVLSFHAGLAATPVEGVAVSPSSLRAYAVTAVPARPGQSGMRNFCADHSGVVYECPAVPAIERGACPSSCKPL